MAELEKVIKGIECHRSGICDNDKTLCPYWNEESDCSKKMLADTLELLKKQTPIEPEYFMDGHVKRCRCKKCGKHIMSVGKYRDNYCAKCGQAVKWE